MANDAYGTHDDFVIDAVLHAYNFSDENFKNELAQSFAGLSYGLVLTTGDEGLISPERHRRNWSIEEIAELTFVESDVDMAVHHGVPLDDYFHDGLSSNEKSIEMHRRWPNRVQWYVGINPLEGRQAVETATEAVTEHGAIGLKFYPERYRGGRGAEPIRLDDSYMAPLLEKAIELDVPVAIHKFVPAGHGVTDHYRIGDVEAAAARYPDLQIEVVHSGMAFLEETSYMLIRYPNVWANLEVTSALAVKFKRRFAEAMGALLSGGAFDRIIFASGCALIHPQPAIDALREFRMPADLMEGYGFPDVTPEMIPGFLGGNFARLHGIDIEAARAAIVDDEFAQRRKALGERPPRWGSVV